MLNEATKNFVEAAWKMKKRIHQTIMSDSIDTMDEVSFGVLKDVFFFIDQAIELTKQQSETLVEVDRKLGALLEKMEG